MSDTQSNESQLLRGAVKPTLIVGAIAIVLFTLTRGLAGFYGALLAQFIVAIYFIVHILVGGEIASYLKLKTHLPLPPQAKP